MRGTLRNIGSHSSYCNAPPVIGPQGPYVIIKDNRSLYCILSFLCLTYDELQLSNKNIHIDLLYLHLEPWAKGSQYVAR